MMFDNQGHSSQDIRGHKNEQIQFLRMINCAECEWQVERRHQETGWCGLMITSNLFWSSPEHLLNVFPQPINQSRVSYTFISATTNHFTGNCREYLACKVYSRIVSWVYLVYHWCCCVSQCLQWLPPKMFSLLSPCYLSTDLRSKISNNSLSWCLLQSYLLVLRQGL